MNGLWISIGIAVLLLCVLGLAFDRDRRHRAPGMHRSTRVDRLEHRVDQLDERTVVAGLIAETVHERMDVLDIPMLSPPPDGYPEQDEATVVAMLPPRRSWWMTSGYAAGILLIVAGVVGAVLMLQAKPTAEHQNEPIPPRPPSPRPVDPPPSDAPAPDGPDRVVVGPAPTTTVTVTVTETAVKVAGPNTPARRAPATSSSPSSTPPSAPPEGPATPVDAPDPCVPPELPTCVAEPQLGP